MTSHPQRRFSPRPRWPLLAPFVAIAIFLGVARLLSGSELSESKAQFAAAAAENPRDWYIDLKKSAKTVRIAVTTGSLGALREEYLAIYRYLGRLDRLASSIHGGSVACETSVLAILAAIKAAETGNMNSGPSSYQAQMARYEAAGDRCYQAISAAKVQT